MKLFKILANELGFRLLHETHSYYEYLNREGQLLRRDGVPAFGPLRIDFGKQFCWKTRREAIQLVKKYYPQAKIKKDLVEIG